MTECSGFVGRFWGHHFEARYSITEKPIGEMKIAHAEGSMSDIMAGFRLTDRTYHGDVCVRCGMVVNDQAKP